MDTPMPSELFSLVLTYGMYTDFRRLGQRSAAMLISPLVGKGAVHQHPSCSSRFKAGPFDGDCTDGGKSAGSDEGGAQFEHSSLPATAKSLFNLVCVRFI